MSEEIQPQYINLANLLTNRLFRIPQYQRAYSWQTKQRKDLFDDIRQSYGAGDGRDHFMATVVRLRREKRVIITDEHLVIDIVDGQQRITTLILLLKAITKNLNSSDSIEKRIRRELLETLVKPDEASLLLLQTNHDASEYFANYVRKGEYSSPNVAKTLADKELLTAIKECEGFVEEWQTSGYSLAQLVGHLKNRLTLIFHEISDEALVYSVFEVLNNRGLEVSWFDRLKSMLMSVIFESETGNKQELINEIHGLWADIYRTIGLRLGLSVESLRFAATLWSDNMPSRLLSEENAASLLFDQSRGSPAKVIESTTWIKSVTEAVDELMADQRLSAVARISHTRLVAVAVNLRTDLTKSEKSKILRRWENVTFRIYGMGGHDARTSVGEYVRLAWRIWREELSIEDIMSELAEIGSCYKGKDVVKDLRRIDAYSELREVLLYFFQRYEEHLVKEAGQNFNNEQWNRIWEAGIADSIEHIAPQSSEREHVHYLGNLMILPPKLNSKLGSKALKDKAEDYIKTGLLVAQDVAQQLRENQGTWRSREIRERERKLLEWAAQEWSD